MTSLGYILNFAEYIPDKYWVSPYTMNPDKNDNPIAFDPEKYTDNTIYDGTKPNDRYIWLVDTYTPGGYEGSGERLGIRKSDKKLVYGYTSHCSCNGPWEDEEYDPDSTKSVTRTMEVLATEAERINWGKELEMNIKLFEDIIETTYPHETYLSSYTVSYGFTIGSGCGAKLKWTHGDIKEIERIMLEE